MRAGVDFASALLHPDTDRSAWGAEDLVSLTKRQLWPRRHDFELGRSQPATAQLFSIAEERIRETTRVVAARMILLHGARAVEVIGLDLFEAALYGKAMLSGSVVNAIADLAGDGWRYLITQAALGPGNVCLKLDEAAFARARTLFDHYVSSIVDSASQEHHAAAEPLDQLLEFVRTHGRVPVGDERPDLRLWCAERRRRFRGGLMSAEEAERLAQLPGWAWYFPGGKNQENGLLRVREFVDLCTARGTCLVPFGTKLSDGADLAGWLRNRRRQYAQGKMAATVSRLLEALPDWTWNHDYWEEGVALQELHSIAEACGTVEDCLTGIGLSRPTASLVSIWRSGIDPARGTDMLEALPGWTWQVESEARETVRCALLALHLSRSSLTPLQLDISTSRLLATSPELLQSIGNRHNLSREAVRQEEGKVLSKASHPVVAHGVHRDLRAFGYSEAVLAEAVSSRAGATAIVALRQACSPDPRYVELVLSAVLGRTLPAGCLAPAVPGSGLRGTAARADRLG